MTKNIAGVDQNARRTTDDAESTRSAGDNLAGLAGQLHDLIGQFHVSG